MTTLSDNIHYRSDLQDADKWVKVLGRIGLVAMAAVNICIGILAVRLAMGERATVSKESALSMIAQQPFGQILLNLVGVGLIIFAIYRIVGAVKDIDAKGSDGKGIFSRVAFALSGLVYGALGASAIGVTLMGGGGGGSSQEQKTAQLLGMPFGQILVGGIGVALVGYGLYQIYKAISKRFFRKFKTETMSSKAFRLVKNTGVAGLTAKGIVVGIIGGFFIQAALSDRASQTGTLSEALSWIIQKPFGRILLYAVAIGLVLYGVYVLLKARYRHFARGPA